MASCCAPSSLLRQLVYMLSLMKLPKAETLASRTAGSQPRARPALMHSRAPWRARHRAPPSSSPAARAVNSRQETRQLPTCQQLPSRVPRPQSSSLDPKTRTGTGDNLMASTGRQHGRARILGRTAVKSPRRDQQSALLLSLPNGSPSSPFWTTFSLRTIDIIVIRRRRPFNAALSLPRGESTAPGSRPDAHSGRGGAQTPGRRPGPRTEARVHPICGISSTRHV